jgi:DsbE subfamily thiol:disulfide oxidoreductase
MVAIRTVVPALRQLGFLAVVLLTLTACSKQATGPTGSASPNTLADCRSGVGTPISGVPASTLPCLVGAGRAVEVSQVHGKPAVINLWASWCAPCRHEMPLLQRAHAAAGEKVQFLGVDVRDSRSRATDFLTAHGVTYAQVYDAQGTFARALGFVGVPDTLVVDAGGHVVFRRAGELTAAQLSEALSRVGAPTDLSEHAS